MNLKLDLELFLIEIELELKPKLNLNRTVRLVAGGRNAQHVRQAKIRRLALITTHGSATHDTTTDGSTTDRTNKLTL